MTHRRFLGFASSYLFCVLLVGVGTAWAQQSATFRPPAVPLITHDPYFSVWSMSDRATDSWSKHWTGANQAMVGLVRANFVRPLRRQRMDFDRCDACHADAHEGQLRARPAPRDCDACHTETRFTPTVFPPDLDGPS